LHRSAATPWAFRSVSSSSAMPGTKRRSSQPPAISSASASPSHAGHGSRHPSSTDTSAPLLHRERHLAPRSSVLGAHPDTRRRETRTEDERGKTGQCKTLLASQRARVIEVGLMGLRHFLSTLDWSRSELDEILVDAAELKAARKTARQSTHLAGKSVAL